VSSIKPNDGSRKINSTQKIPRSFIVTGGNGSILLELGKKVLNQITSFVQLLVIFPWLLAVASGRNHCRLSLGLQRFNHPCIGIVPLICQNRLISTLSNSGSIAQ
jgi:hypothetical protein